MRSQPPSLVGLLLRERTIENRSLVIAVSTIVAAVVAQALDVFFASMTVYLRRRGGVVETARSLLPVAAAAIPLYAPLVAFPAIGYDQLSAWATTLFIVPRRRPSASTSFTKSNVN